MRVYDGDKWCEAKAVSDDIIGAISQERMKIIKLCSNEPKTPKEMATVLGMSHNTIYYHLNVLEENGLIEKVEGKYISREEAMVMIVNPKWRMGNEKSVPKILSSIAPKGKLNARIVVGHPLPHGRYKGSANDPILVEFSMWLGDKCAYPHPPYLFDISIKEPSGSYIVVGGPKVNMFQSKLNQMLPIRFSSDSFEITSSVSGKTYSQNVGIVGTIENPFGGGSVLIASGSTSHGTEASIKAIMERGDEICEGNEHNKDVKLRVVEGFDKDCDGIVDSFSFLE